MNEDSSKIKVINYEPSKTILEFMRSDARVRGIMGPVGSGKSVGCVIELYRRAIEQYPNSDGLRETRFAIVRNTYGELKSTTIKTFQEWIPPSICPLVYDAPIRGTLRCNLEDGTRVESLFYFVAIDRPEDAGKVLSMDLTGCWINEAREMEYEVIRSCLERTRRYPPAKNGASLKWGGLIMDTNPMPDSHWWYREAEELRTEGREFFRHPGALKRNKEGVWVPNELAENVKHQQLKYNYWLEMVDPTDDDYNAAMLGGEYANVSLDRAVYAGVWQDGIHVSKEPLNILPSLPLWLGWDFGLTPSVVFGQLTAGGQRRILGELVSEDMGLTRFVETVVSPELRNKYNECRKIISFADPAGGIRSQTDERTCLEILRSCGIPTDPAPGHNSLTARLEAVRSSLSKLAGNGVPAFILDPSCVQLRRGFNGGYHYKRVAVSGSSRYKDSPDKNEYSHVHDALQYMLLGMCDGKIGNSDYSGKYGRNGLGNGEVIQQQGWN